MTKLAINAVLPICRDAPAVNPVSDQDLMAAVKSGDHSAFADLYDRHAALLLGVAYRILQNRRDAEDLLHDVFLEVWHKVSSYEAQRGTVRNWLVMRVRSRAIDRLRMCAVARKHAMIPPDEEYGGERPDEEVDRSSESMRAHRALKRLSDDQRVVVKLSYFEGLTYQEIANHCGIPVGTVKSRMSAAMTTLRKELERVGGAG